jgi:hypothetical protein
MSSTPWGCRPSSTMYHNTVLLAIPEAVSKHIFAEWFKLTDIARLDSAFCTTKSRPAFLSTAYSSTTVHNKWYEGNWDDLLLDHCARWCLARGARVEAVTSRSGVARVDSMLREKFFILQGPCLRRIEITEGTGQDYRGDLLTAAKFCHFISALELCSGNEHSWDDGLLAITAACPHLRTIRLRSIRATSEAYGRAFQQCKSLESLVIRDLHSVPTAVALPSLTSLDLQDCSVTDNVMAAVGLNCPKLQSLMVFYGNAVTDVGVEAVLEGCPLLRETDLWYATGVGHELRVELARRANLTELRLGSWVDLDDELLQGLMKVCPQLTELVVLDTSHEAISDSALAVCAQHCPLLLEYRMDAGNVITSAGAVNFFRAQSNLRIIAFDNCLYVNDDVVRGHRTAVPAIAGF